MELKSLVRTGAWVLLTKSFGAGAMFLVMFFFARWLGPSDFGLFSLALTIVTIASVISRWGLDQIVTKQVAVHSENKHSLGGKGKSYVLSALLVVCLFSIFFAIGLWSLAGPMSEIVFNKPGLGVVLKVLAWGVIPLSVGIILTEAFKALGRVVLSSFLQNVLIPLLVLMLSIFFVTKSSFDLSHAALVYFLALFLCFIITLSVWNNIAPRLKNAGYISFSQIVKDGWPMILVASGALIMSWSDIVIVGVYATASDLGVYSVASRLVMLSMLALVAMNSITAPRYARLYKERRFKEVASLARRSSAILIILVSVPSFIFFIYPNVILGWYGADYALGENVLLVLAVGQLVNVGCGSVGYLLTMTGKQVAMQKIMLTTAMVNIILSICMVQFFGILGVALATASSVIMWNVWAMIEVRKHLGFWVVSPNIIANLK